MEVDKNLIKSWESVSKTIDPEHPDRIIFKFGTYGWSFPSQFKDGIHKNGITKEIKDPGTKRMTEACSGKKTAIPEEPFVIQNSEIVWTIPFEISSGLLTEANKFARKFDIECNKALAKYKVKLSDQRMVGEEWYRLTVPQATKIRQAIWKKLLGRELAKKEADAKRVRTKIELKKGLQEKAHQAVLDELKKGTERFKGIAPTGFGKTVLAWKIFTDAYALGLIKGKVSIMTAPSQFLCNKNSIAFDTYNGINGITGIVNQPIFSGQDVGVFENENEFQERKARLEKQLAGQISSGNRVILHVCINSMKLVDEVLNTLGIPALDLMIVDEAHTLASHRDNNDKTYLGTVRNFCLFDENIKVSHRFFLTATEKNLVNPDILNTEQIFAYMNNEDYFGGYAFQFSYAECVVDRLIVPFRCKVFEYSDTTKDVVKMMKMGIDKFLLDDLALRDNEGDIGQVSINLIRVLVSSLKVIKERNKMLLIVSRNSHADLLENALELLKNNPNYSFLVDVNVNKITTPYYPKPGARQDEFEIIHESDEKHIIICGPWAITGTDCPSIDAVLWGFLPGTEITSTQGTGRGTRTHAGKQDLLVAFNLDVSLTPGDLKNNLLRTIYKLNEGMFPAHDLKLSLKVRKILGRTFNEVEKDKEAEIKPEVRVLLDDFYEAASGVELFNFVNSSAFLNGGRPSYHDFDYIHDLAKKSLSTSIDHFFYKYIPTLNDPMLPHSDFWIRESKEFKEMGPDKFLGMEKIEELRELIFLKMEEILENEYKLGSKYKDIKSKLIKYISKYFPKITKSVKRGRRTIENPEYDPMLYEGIKGFPLAVEYQTLIYQFEKKYGSIKERFGGCIDYYTLEDIQKIAIESPCTALSQFFEEYLPSLNDQRARDYLYYTLYNKEYAEKFKEIGISNFIGMGEVEIMKNKLFEDAELFVLNCVESKYSSRYARKILIDLFNQYCPYVRRNTKREDKGKDNKSDFINNPDYKIELYAGLRKGFPFASIYNSLMSQYKSQYGKVSDRLEEYMDQNAFRDFLLSNRISTLLDYKKYCETVGIDYLCKIGAPDYRAVDSKYPDDFLDTVLYRRKNKEKWSFEKTVLIHKEILDGLKKPSFKLKEVLDREGIDQRGLYLMFEYHGLDPIEFNAKHERISKEELSQYLGRGLKLTEIARMYDTSPPTIRRAIVHHNISLSSYLS